MGPKRAECLLKLGIHTVKDLLYHFPRDYSDYTNVTPIADTVCDSVNVIRATVIKRLSPAFIRKGMTVFRAIVADDTGEMTVVIYNSSYQFDSLVFGQQYILSGKVTGNLMRREISSPTIIKADADEKILPLYHLTEGLTQQVVRSAVKNAIALLNTEIYEPVQKKYLLENNFSTLSYALKNIHFPEDMRALAISKERLIFDEFLVLQLGMSMLKTKRSDISGCKMQSVSLDDFYRSLPFELTGAQKRAISDCTADMCRSISMNRLVQGDVGSGKTAVAAACAFFAAKNGMQTALMAPTEILANQHFETLAGFLEPLGVKVCLLTGAVPKAEKNSIKQNLADGECNVCVGTHAIIQSTTVFKSLGLVITDEQHRFGVEQRAKLSAKGDNPHRLVMSATPIPRTLALMIYGDLDISIINELPKGRIPIKTYAVTGKLRQRAFGFVRDRLDEGRQAYIVCPMIDESELDLKSVEKYAANLKKIGFANYKIGLLHGRLTPEQKDAVMGDFKAGNIDILVATTVIEVGVDVPNAAVMVIENADRFGLSQLHQLRGRVGRGNYQSYCILITDNVTEQSKKRLRILSSTTDGFLISEEDLKLRGPGDFFGQRQHGLPKLKIAACAENMDVLSVAQTAAKNIIAEDKTLSLPQNKLLKELVDELFGEGLDLN